MNGLINLTRGISHVLAAFTTNCVHFHQEWQRHDVRGEGTELSGRWQGEWESGANGHRGQLRCVLTKLDAQHYRACFHATYAKILRVCYCIPLAGERSQGRLLLKGESDLGKLAGGIYRYEGEVTSEEFFVTYRCRYDHGAFRLRR